MTDLCPITLTTGESSNKLGITRLDIAAIATTGNVMTRDLWRTGLDIQDRQTNVMPASTIATNAANYVGKWTTRSLIVHDKQLLFVKYEVKSAADLILKTLTFPVIADASAAHIELTFPVITDQHSTTHQLMVSGRIRLPPYEEFEAIDHQGDPDGMRHILRSAERIYDDFGEDELIAHWSRVCKEARITDSPQPLFRISPNARSEIDVTLRHMVSAPRSEPGHSKKVISASSGKKITIARKRRKLTI